VSRERTSIFQAEALRRYAQSRERSVLPHLISPRVFVRLWLLVAVLLTGGVIVVSTVRARLSRPSAAQP
jgi:hypothetical protein